MIINYKFIGDYKDSERKNVEYEDVDNTIQIILPIESILNEEGSEKLKIFKKSNTNIKY